MAESDADRMLRAQREWQAAKKRGEDPWAEFAPAAERKQARRGWRWWHIALAIFGGIIAFQLIWQTVDPDGHAAMLARQDAQRIARESAKAAADADKLAAANERRQKGFHCLSAWNGSNADTVRQVKDILRNPKSFEHIETMIHANYGGEHGLWMTYRAQNGFGGMNIERIYARVDHESCKARVLPNGPGSG